MKNFPGTPEKNNALAVPSERCTDDVNNQAEGTQKKNAIALPSERGMDDVNNQAEYRVKHFPGNPQTKTR